MANYRQCQADSKRTGERCKARAMSGKDVCYHHGGKSASGIGSATFKHGRYSDALPRGLRESHEAALKDEAYIELRDEVALLQARTHEVLGKLDATSGESASTWKELVRLWTKFQEVSEAKDTTSAGRILSMIGSMIEEGSGHSRFEAEAWDEIREMVRDRRQLAEAERKRITETQNSIRSDQALALVEVLVDTVRRHVHDRQVLAAISADISQFVLADPRELSAN